MEIAEENDERKLIIDGAMSYVAATKSLDNYPISARGRQVLDVRPGTSLLLSRPARSLDQPAL